MGELILDYVGDNITNPEHISISLDKSELAYFDRPSNKFFEYYSNKFTKLIKSEFFKRKVCDVHRYNLEFLNNKWVLTKPCCGKIVNKKTVKKDKESISQCDKEITKIPEANNILIILESPHKEEYDSQFNPTSPANGATGKKFLQYFCSHALPILELFGLILCTQKVYSICFVNPVPFQASLNCLHKKNI